MPYLWAYGGCTRPMALSIDLPIPQNASSRWPEATSGLGPMTSGLLLECSEAWSRLQISLHLRMQVWPKVMDMNWMLLPTITLRYSKVQRGQKILFFNPWWLRSVEAKTIDVESPPVCAFCWRCPSRRMTTSQGYCGSCLHRKVWKRWPPSSLWTLTFYYTPYTYLADRKPANW